MGVFPGIRVQPPARHGRAAPRPPPVTGAPVPHFCHYSRILFRAPFPGRLALTLLLDTREQSNSARRGRKENYRPSVALQGLQSCRGPGGFPAGFCSRNLPRHSQLFRRKGSLPVYSAVDLKCWEHTERYESRGCTAQRAPSKSQAPAFAPGGCSQKLGRALGELVIPKSG